MDTRLCGHRWDGMSLSGVAWIEALSAQGMHCCLNSYGTSPHLFKRDGYRAGQTDVINLDVAWQSITPNPRHATSGNADDLFVKIIVSGVMSVEQRGQTMTFGQGDIAVVDLSSAFVESFREPTRMSVLRIPKSALGERGVRCRFSGIFRPDLASADVGAVRAVILNLASRASHVSESVIARLGDQCLDLMDVLVDDHAVPDSRRTGAITVLRVKQVVLRHICNPDLSVAQIAAELNVSASSLTRTLKVEGLSPMYYAWTLRLEHSMQLLAGAPRGAIRQIAYKCGFQSAAHFSRAFKERYGMTPSEYAITHKAVPREVAQAPVNG
jgi:AraC-like DNA-binding protein